MLVMQIIPDSILLGLLASGAAGLATGFGAIPVLIGGKFSRKSLDMMLGFAAGVMLAASSFSLLVPSLEISTAQMGPALAVFPVSVGFLLGGVFVHLADRYVPHEHFIKGHEGPPSQTSRIWLLILAITIHNFPEGLAVGVAFGWGPEHIGTGVALALAIGIQNVPEGLAVAMPMVREGYSIKKASSYAILTGLVEPIGGLIGVSVVSFVAPILPYALAFAAGAMVFVVSDEMVPESHSGGFARTATIGLMIGFVIMMVLDNIFG